eukprot:gene13892-gene1158
MNDHIANLETSKGCFNVCSSLQQHLDQVGMSVVTSPDKGRQFSFILGFDIYSSLQQHLDHVGMSIVTSSHKCCRSLLIIGFDVCS